MTTAQVASKRNAELLEFADVALADLRARFPEEELGRIRGFLDIATEQARPSFHKYQSTRMPRLHFPGLPPEPFYDPTLFPEAADLETAFPVIREEITALLDGTVEAVQYESRWSNWKKLQFYDGGPHARQDETCGLFPKTSAVVDRIVAGYEDFLTAGFLIQDGRMSIPPHLDLFNVYVSLWLPLVVPAGCGIEVADQQRPIEPGKCLAFDNSYLHTSWNDSDEPRVVLAIYRLSPRLTRTERLAFVHLKTAYGDRMFQGAAPTS